MISSAVTFPPVALTMALIASWDAFCSPKRMRVMEGALIPVWRAISAGVIAPVLKKSSRVMTI